MTTGMFLIQAGKLVEMREQPYDSEDVLQALLARYPSLLSGDQINPEAPRRWLLVSREMGVPDELDGGSRWSMDHLLLDQDGIPTIVEVKRGTDTRLRRQVVGQMLDYAANAVVYWPVERLRARFEVQCEADGRDAAEVLSEFLGDSAPDHDFWINVSRNLQAGRVRLVFVADVIPTELRRIIEFLNEQMSPADVLGVEIRQYVGEQMQTLVPRVIGVTAEAQQRKSVASGASRTWDEASFLSALQERVPVADVDAARALLAAAPQLGLRTSWGQGQQDGAFTFILDRGGRKYSIVRVYSYGRLEVLFESLKTKQPFADEGLRNELLNRLNQLAGVVLPADAIDRRPAIPLATLANQEVRKKFS